MQFISTSNHFSSSCGLDCLRYRWQGPLALVTADSTGKMMVFLYFSVFLLGFAPLNAASYEKQPAWQTRITACALWLPRFFSFFPCFSGAVSVSWAHFLHISFVPRPKAHIYNDILWLRSHSLFFVSHGIFSRRILHFARLVFTHIQWYTHIYTYYIQST